MSAREAGSRIVGTPGAAGVAIGPVWRYRLAASGRAGAGSDAAEGQPAGRAVAGDPAAPIRAAAAEAARQLESLAERLRELGRAR